MSLAVLTDARLLAAGVGGTLAGSLHAVTGPDHLAALLPISIGQRWWRSVYAGAYWGLGHGIGAALVGMLAFCIRDALNLDVLCTYMEAAVGISIMVIGANGVREAKEWIGQGGGEQAAACESAPTTPTAPVMSEQAKPSSAVVSTLTTGILHGCSGSGHLLGVMPALAMPSWACAATYLSAFGFGTMLAMCVFTALVGEVSMQMGARLKQPNVTAKISLVSSFFALTMGLVWTLRACLALALPQQAARALALSFRRLLLALAAAQ